MKNRLSILFLIGTLIATSMAAGVIGLGSLLAHLVNNFNPSRIVLDTIFYATTAIATIVWLALMHKLVNHIANYRIDKLKSQLASSASSEATIGDLQNFLDQHLSLRAKEYQRADESERQARMQHRKDPDDPKTGTRVRTAESAVRETKQAFWALHANVKEMDLKVREKYTDYLDD